MSFIPTLALVGRPNVGKSTLFNRLTGTRDAIVANLAGLTRDRKYGDAEINGKRFIVVDTGGISGEEEGIDGAMADQSLLAMEEADIILFILDSRQGLTAADQQIANHLRRLAKPMFVVANKIDGLNPDVAGAAFFELGLGDVHTIAAEHGRGVGRLMDKVLEHVPEYLPDPEENAHGGIKMAIIGRPNVGKSTLVNRLLGEDRVVVYDHPGTTRDSIYIHYERHEKPYTIIDTAGVRRRKNVKMTVEKFSIVKALQAIEDANVVIMVMDSTEGVVDQDLHIMGHAIEKGRALVVALNKWDGLEADHKDRVKTELERRLRFVEYADLHFISALHGTGVGNLYKSVERAYQSATEKYSSNFLTRILEAALHSHQPPLVRGRRIKLRYAHAGGHNPPIIVIHGNQTDDVPNHYVRYLEKTFRRALDLHGTPIKIEFRTSDNPYAGRKNKLTDRQIAKKRRLMKHVRKKSK